MKKKMAWMLSVCMMLCLFVGCRKQEKTADSIIVFAASSMTEALTELGDRYMEEYEGVEIIFNFDSSGTLEKQIEEGADCDIFISAGEMQMDALDKNQDGLDFVLADSRFDILENKVVLAVPEGNPADIRSYEDLKEKLEEGTILLAMGNADVPAGQYTQKILQFYSMDEAALAASGCITYGSNVKEVTTHISEAVVDCGVIYQTDALAAGLTIVDTATAEMCGQVIYPAAVLNHSQNPEAAQAFLEYLKSDAADVVFGKAGFTPAD